MSCCLQFSLWIDYDAMPFRCRLTCEGNLTARGLGLLGMSGSGKSSILKAIAGIGKEVPYRVQFGRYCWDSTSTDNPCVYVNQTLGLFSHLTVAQELEKTVQLSHTSISDPKIHQQLIDDFNIGDLLHKSTQVISAGETQRVLIVRAFVSGKSVLLLDEALSAIDQSTRDYIMQTIQSWCDKLERMYIVTSHHVSDISKLCGESVILQSSMLSEVLPTPQAVMQYTDNAASIFAPLQVVCEQRLPEQGIICYRLKNSEQRIYRRDSTHALSAMQQVDKIHISAIHVSICETSVGGISMLNKLLAEITQITPSSGDMLIELDVDGQALFSVISRKSYTDMQLTLGQQVLAVFKAV